jgi:hypothetical protein
MIKINDQNVGLQKNNFIYKPTYESKVIKKTKTPQILPKQDKKLSEKKDVWLRNNEAEKNNDTKIEEIKSTSTNNEKRKEKFQEKKSVWKEDKYMEERLKEYNINKKKILRETAIDFMEWIKPDLEKKGKKDFSFDEKWVKKQQKEFEEDNGEELEDIEIGIYLIRKEKFANQKSKTNSTQNEITYKTPAARPEKNQIPVTKQKIDNLITKGFTTSSTTSEDDTEEEDYEEELLLSKPKFECKLNWKNILIK